MAAAILKDALKVSSAPTEKKVSSLNDDGFTTVGKKNKPVVNNAMPSQMKAGSRVQYRGTFDSRRQSGAGNIHFSGKQGNQQDGNNRDRFGQFGKSFKKQGSFGRNDKVNQQGGFVKKNSVQKDVSKSNNQGTVGNQKKSLRQLSRDPNFKPKIIVRGSGSGSNPMEIQEEVVPISNSFDHLSDDVMNEEFESNVWPKLKGEVDDIMEAGIYPSKAIRADWSLHQMDYFYNNCHKFHLDPTCEDEEEDVESETDGIATNMKPEFDVNTADALVNDSVDNQEVSNGI